MILQLDVPPCRPLTLFLHSPLVRLDARHYKQVEMHDQDQGQEDIGRDLHLAQLIYQGVARLTPEVVRIVAEELTAELELHGLPPPEPAQTHRKDDCWDCGSPYEQVGCQHPARVYRPTLPVVKREEDEEGVEDPRYDQLRG